MIKAPQLLLISASNKYEAYRLIWIKAHLRIVGCLTNELTIDFITQLNTFDAVGDDTLQRKDLLIYLQLPLEGIEDALGDQVFTPFCCFHQQKRTLRCLLISLKIEQARDTFSGLCIWISDVGNADCLVNTIISALGIASSTTPTQQDQTKRNGYKPSPCKNTSPPFSSFLSHEKPAFLRAAQGECARTPFGMVVKILFSKVDHGELCRVHIIVPSRYLECSRG